MDENIYRVLALRVREERRRAGYTLERLAERAGITGAFIAHIEAGRKRATLDTVSKLAAALGMRTSDLLQENHQDGRGDDLLLQQVGRAIRHLTPKQKKGVVELVRAASALTAR